MAAVSEVPDVTRQKWRLARCRSLSECEFHLQKAHAKGLDHSYFAILCRRIDSLCRSDLVLTFWSDELWCEVNAGDAAAACRSNDTRATADAAPQVYHLHARIDTSALDMLARSFDSAAVELIERKKILVGRALRVNASLHEKCDHAIQDSTHGVSLSYRVCPVCHSLLPLLVAPLGDNRLVAE